MQDFLTRTRWDAEAVRDDLQDYVVEHLGDEKAVLVLDETGFVKKGTRSVGVKRQYSGTAGRIENCQVAVFLGYASRHGRALIDRALYLPEDWAADEERRRVAGVPEDVAFATKPKLGRAMLERAVAAGVPCAWVAADSVYGGDYALWLERQPIGYVVAVTSKQRAPSGFDSVKIRTQACFGADDWRRLSAGEGAKGPRLYDWAYKDYPSLQPGWNRGLLVRRSIAEPDKLTYYLTFAPDGTPVSTLVSVAGTRWTIESCFEAAKSEVGLDQYELDRLAPPRHPRHAGPGLPHRRPSGGHRGDRTPSIFRKISCPSPFRRSACCSPVSSTGRLQIPPPLSPGHSGEGAISSAHAAATGNGAPKPIRTGCSTRACLQTAVG
jgi:SRSO17 transposase